MSFHRRILSFTGQNCVNAACLLLQSLKVRVTVTTVKQQLISHPDYPSLLSIRDLLLVLNVKNESMQVPPDKLDLIALPFLAQIRKQGGEYFTVVTRVSADTVTCMKVKGNTLHTIPRKVFMHNWTGAIMQATTSHLSGEPDYAVARLAEKTKTIATAGLCLLLIGCWFVTGLYALQADGEGRLAAFFLATLKLMGLIVSLLLLVHEVDTANPLLQKVCKVTRYVNCAAVLRTKAARIWGGLSWSEMGFAYFAGGWLMCTGSLLNPAVTGLLAWVNIGVWPYILFSVYYQWRVIKQWCRLCLMVQAIFLLEGGTAIVGGLYHETGLLHAVTWIWIMIGLFPVTGWLLLKPLFLLPKKYIHTRFMLNRFKLDGDIFAAALYRNNVAPVQDATGLGITIGPAAAVHKIIKVCNPYCNPCSAAHTVLEALLDTYDNIQVQIIFTAGTDETDPRRDPVMHFMAIAASGNEALVKQALHDWYSHPQKNYAAFAAGYPVKESLLQQQWQVDRMYAWVNNTGINGTPAFFYNGYALPNTYSISDMKLLLDMAEQLPHSQ
ncbi:vitamin K epoxide reductase family protein [Chitinophaga nivalis]|uniref:Cysteine peptidase family C39 domain-containing protein n=1 Tax=Chitinophaga nivalis TaxID=2991709 RepID=A0ABT3II72_9BACT|nr:vitamin K epoxide reductase family protein [Chitinophaga nivalis]MCW3466647.1 cysteine peptidase family C39 domain-containing protein [Chitinophaga nivalis]MCW3483662.1 cysteine peptidase family C39 domain-containing protein [Chitinophaga nivalis]